MEKEETNLLLGSKPEDTTFCNMVGRAFMLFKSYHINITDMADLTNTYITWHDYGVKLGDLYLAYHSDKISASEYTEKGKHYSMCKYKAMRRIVRFMDKHLNIEHMGSVPANALYDELFGKGNWERSLINQLADYDNR